MRRREFIALVGGTAASWPFAARAQQSGLPLVGFINSQSPEAFASYAGAFRRGLMELGYVEGRNVAIAYRWGQGKYDALPSLAADLVARHPALIVATGGEPAAAAVKAATWTIPLVFLIGGDPVQQGLVASFNRPGGNVTGITLLNITLDPKRLGLLRELQPNSKTFALLANPNFPDAEARQLRIQDAAEAVGVELRVVSTTSAAEIDEKLSELETLRADALLVASDPFFNSRREQIVALVARKALPAMYEWREFVAAGGLISYGTDLTEVYRQVGKYAGRILKGEKPADLPVVQPTKFELIINLKTAKTLGIEIPPTLLALADEVIE